MKIFLRNAGLTNKYPPYRCPVKRVLVKVSLKLLHIFEVVHFLQTIVL